ncbi:hypothetical protein PMPD1_3111 [Paramixta manurensis]|uniref:Uncharacterized protein n=1 Tax=Paramixta manurensis TaxID=2740817 RepID=A0A6M8USK0_9GAMM|nr:hypothetical protein PMPD1_3111 [Erwiniaceae bacterium PD-1]
MTDKTELERDRFERRNCYVIFGVHLAFKAWHASANLRKSDGTLTNEGTRAGISVKGDER